MTGAGVEVWRGGVNAWECDEMGHMNVRFHLTRAQEGLAGLARRLRLPDAFRSDAVSTLNVREMHVRFHREAHAGAPLSMSGAVTRWGGSDADVALVLRHPDETVASTFRLRVEHATPEGRVFAWPDRAREAAQALISEVPTEAQGRSLAFGDDPQVSASLARADALDLVCIGRGVLQPSGCDVHGRMRPDEFIGRVSDGAARLVRPLREAARACNAEARRVGGAVLEYRLLIREPARAGDHLELRSGLVASEGKVTRVVHWMLDPERSRPWVSSEAVVVSFDLDTRKALAIAGEARQALAAHLKPELGL